jgi:hypothetical protein
MESNESENLKKQNDQTSHEINLNVVPALSSDSKENLKETYKTWYSISEKKIKKEFRGQNDPNRDALIKTIDKFRSTFGYVY